MASTVLPNGIIIPEKFSRDWYSDLYHNWEELDNLLAGGTPKDGTLTIQKNGSTVGTFSANQATDETIDITVPDVNNGTLTIQQNGTTVDTFTANASSNVTANITVPTKTSDLTNDSGFLTSADALPIGSYIQFAGSQAPAGFLVCNGGAISRTTYSALFAVIGTIYGSGDGSTTFNLPNLTDRFLQGSASVGTVKDAGLPNIYGEIICAIRGDKAIGGAFVLAAVGGQKIPFTSTSSDGSKIITDAQIAFNAHSNNSIYGKSSTVQPPALTCLICIKY